ncbi:MAG: hypothetical protein NTZ93_01365 [Candidatus Beckwithbacteria bacterium]|nr:hypothetical protein [Candidatus Beckwithbacteria bacterium]
MINLSQNPLFWPNQADFIVDQTKPNIFLGTGIATETKISQAAPFDLIGFLLSAEFVKLQIPKSQVFLLVADQHAWLANNLDREQCKKAAANLHQIIQIIITNFKLENWYIFKASEIFPNALPQSYEALETRDVLHFFNQHNCGLKIGWSFSLAETNHKTDESHFDQQFGLPIQSIFTKPGVTINPNKPQESPYLSTDPAARIIIDQHSTPEWNVAKLNPAVKNHLNRITILFEKLINAFPNKTPLENKLKSIINLICQ